MTLLFRLRRRGLPTLVAGMLLVGASCGPPDGPEVIAISYVRATNGGDPDTAVALLDLGRITERVEEQIVLVHSTDSETFLEDSIETFLWGLFRETQPEAFSYDATPAEIDGDSARVTVSKTDADGKRTQQVVHLRRTNRGWRVSGASLDRLVTYVIQRLQERY